ncbi:hypothetical protein BHE74_00055779 [Ensete ventricosum]|nr:hypothetical protein BHE74_00055779 [Ensete ventricosum]
MPCDVNLNQIFGLPACIDHRGTPVNPARTCTLQPEEGAICVSRSYWGAAYCVRGDTERERAAMKVESHIVIETSLPYIVRSSAEPPFLFSSI